MTVKFSSEHRDSLPSYPDTQIYKKRVNYQIASYLFVPTAWVFLAQKKISKIYAPTIAETLIQGVT